MHVYVICAHILRHKNENFWKLIVSVQSNSKRDTKKHDNEAKNANESRSKMREIDPGMHKTV